MGGHGSWETSLLCSPFSWKRNKATLYAAAAKSLQSCPTLCDPMDCSLPGSSVHRIFQARGLEWGAIAFSGHSLYPPPIRELYMKATIKGRAFACKAIIARLKTVQSFHPFNFVIPYSREESVVSSGRLVSKFLWKCLLCASACSHISIPGTWSLGKKDVFKDLSTRLVMA